MYKDNDWTSSELKTLKELYPNGRVSRASILEALPNRSWFGITKKALKCGLARRNVKKHIKTPWSEDEIILLYTLYPVASPEEIIAAIPGHSWNAIRVKACKEGLVINSDHQKVARGAKWTKAEMDIVATYYPTSPKAEIMAKLPRRSWPLICAKASMLNLTRYHGLVRISDRDRALMYAVHEEGRLNTMAAISSDITWDRIKRELKSIGDPIHAVTRYDAKRIEDMLALQYDTVEIAERLGYHRAAITRYLGHKAQGKFGVNA